MQKIIFLKGLPGSGKSTWAKRYCKENSDTLRFNKDDLREELGNKEFSRDFENKVLQIQRGRAILALADGFSIIIDDTNFSNKHFEYWSKIAQEGGFEFELKYFDTPVDVCIDRDKHREKSVGEGVIIDMYKRYVKQNYIKTDTRLITEQDEKLPKCVIFDIDGTLALMSGRNPFDDSKIHTDKPNKLVIDILKRYNLMYAIDSMESDGEENSKVILMSGRMDKCRIQTENWLKQHNVSHDFLYMRTTNDFRQDDIVKRELYEEFIKDKYYVEAWFDDRDQVVKMIREELGLLCCQVYYGNF